MTPLLPAFETLRHLEPRRLSGRVTGMRGGALMVEGLRLPVGSTVRVEPQSQAAVPATGEVVGFEGGRAVIFTLEGGSGIAPGDRVEGAFAPATALVGDSLVGRVLDGLGRPLDGGAAPQGLRPRPLQPRTMNPLARCTIREPLPTGVRAVDAALTVGRGQRLGIFAGAGVGKSTLLGAMARHTAADVSVVALIGERGREVRDFVDGILGPEGLRRSVVVASTGDESPLLRLRACLTALAVAEHFRDQGRHVLLVVDSLTRLAHAQRQVGLAAGEAPATKGYPPSVFALLPKLIERAGALDGGGSITGLFAVLVDGDDLSDPVSDAARSVLDGHVVLSRRLASRGHFPAIDVPDSVSRVADAVSDASHRKARRTLLRLLSAQREVEELVAIGAYARGSNPDADVAIALREKLDRFLRQEPGEAAEYPRTLRTLVELDLEAEALRPRMAAAAAAAQPAAAARRAGAAA